MTVMRTAIVIILSYSCWTNIASSQVVAPRDVKDLRLIWQEKSVKSMTFEFASIPPKDGFRGKHIDPAIESHMKDSLWQGIFYKEILANVKSSEDTSVTVIGSDNYLVELPYSLLTKHDVLLALFENGKRTSWTKGGAMTVFPIDDKKIPEKFRTDQSYWVWTVGSIVVGTIDPVLTIKKAKEVNQVNLKTLRNTLKRTDSPRYPAGSRLNPTIRKSIETTYVSFDVLAKDLLASGDRGVFVETYVSQSGVFVGDKLKDYVVVTAWDGKPIPAIYGGPIQICPKDEHNGNCTFFVNTVEIAP